MPDLPTGAKLDCIVLWAVGALNTEGGMWRNDITFYAVAKSGVLDEQLVPDDQQAAAVGRSLERLIKAGLVELDTGTGYHLVKPE